MSQITCTNRQKKDNRIFFAFCTRLHKMCPVIYSAVTYEHCNIVMSPYTDLQAVVKLSEYSDYRQSTDSRFRYRSLAALNAFIAHITIFQIDDNVFPKLCNTYIVILKIADDIWKAVSPCTDSSCTIRIAINLVLFAS